MDVVWGWVKDVLGLQPGELADWVSGLGTLAAALVAFIVWRADVRAKARAIPDSFKLTVLYTVDEQQKEIAHLTWVNGSTLPIWAAQVVYRSSDGDPQRQMLSSTEIKSAAMARIDAGSTGGLILRDINLSHRFVVMYFDADSQVRYKMASTSKFVDALESDYDALLNGSIATIPLEGRLARFRFNYQKQKYVPWRWVQKLSK